MTWPLRDGQAVQLLALAAASAATRTTSRICIDGMRAKIASAGLPAGLRVDLARSVAVQVDSAEASGNTADKVQDLSLIFVVVLLVLIFRSLTLAIATVLPALLSVLDLRPTGRRGGQAWPAGIAARPVPADRAACWRAWTDYGLFLRVFRFARTARGRP